MTNKKNADSVTQASTNHTPNYIPSSSGAEAMARLAREIRRAQFIGVSTPADTELLTKFLKAFDRLAENRETMPTHQWLSECNDARELAGDIVSRLVTGRVELKGVI